MRAERSDSELQIFHLCRNLGDTTGLSKGHVALALSGGCVCLSLWLLLSVGSQGRNPNPAGTLTPCLTLLSYLI